MATVVSITNPVTGAVEQVDKLDATAQQIDDAVALAPQLSNPNLLDNWYFGKPVNQRGQAEYAAAEYTIDRWKFEVDGSSKSVIVSGEGVEIKSGDDTTYCNFTQIVERLPAGTYTVSFLVDDFANVNQVFCSATNTSLFLFDKNVVSLKFTLTADTESVKIGVQKKLDAAALTIIAAKLELGDQQTLAHQDADGNWVLNEIPDYGEQLRRCQRYAYVMNNSSPHYAAGFGHTVSTTQAQVFFPVPVKMRANPTVSFTAGSAWAIKCNGATVIPTSISAWFASDYVIGVKVTGTFPGANYNIDMTSNAGENIIFSADL